MSTTTIFLGRLLGLYLVAISVGTPVNRRRTLDTLYYMARSGSWTLFSRDGRCWDWLRDGARPPGLERRRAAGCRTLIGGAAPLKGIGLLLVPAKRVADAYKGIGFERFFHDGWSSCG